MRRVRYSAMSRVLAQRWDGDWNHVPVGTFAREDWAL